MQTLRNAKEWWLGTSRVDLGERREMGTEETIAPFTDDEIRTFTSKLEAWGASLPEREQQLLGAIVLDDVPPDGDDTRGYFWASWPAIAAQLESQVRSQAEKRLETQRKDLTRNWAG
jgi:hypothetical protein